MAFQPKWVVIHSDNETPKLGSGRRIVYLEGLGYKWARMRSLDGVPQRLRRERFDQIFREDASRQDMAKPCRVGTSEPEHVQPETGEEQ